MPSLPCPDPLPLRLELDPSFEPCETVDGDELYPNGIFEFNITRLSAHIAAKSQFHVELIALDDISYGGTSPGLNELTIAAADLSRPVILAEISPGRYNLIDGNHRVAKARRNGVPRIPAFRIPCPEHVAFLTSTRAYEKYVEYWNSKVDDILGTRDRPRPVGAVRRGGSIGRPASGHGLNPR
jgi:hypothetical protein